MKNIKCINKNNYIIYGAPAGEIEVLIDIPKQITDCIMLLHPHPQKNGSMHNKVITTAANFCIKNNIGVIRFNFRGVGKSSGDFGNLYGELEDSIFIANWLKQNWQIKNLHVAGFSFGGAIAYLLAQQVRIQKMLLISPALHLVNKITTIDSQICHIMHSTTDEIINCKTIENIVTPILSSSVQLHILQNVSHFYHGKLNLITQACKNLFTII